MESPETPVSRIQGLRLAAVLEDCSDQLEVLGLAMTLQLKRERGAMGAAERARLVKLKEDCEHIRQQMSKIGSELQEKQTFTSLMQVLEEEDKRRKVESVQREVVREQEQRNLNLREKAAELQQKTKNLEELQLQAEFLKHELEKQPSKTDERKVRQMNVDVQLERIKAETGRAERQLEDRRELLKEQLKQEARNHTESVDFLEHQNEEFRERLQGWRQRTQQTVQESEGRLGRLRDRRAENTERLWEMRRKYGEMEEVVMEDAAEQERRRQEQEVARAATKLQAWWRGCVVRRSLKKAEEAKKGKKRKKEAKKK